MGTLASIKLKLTSVSHTCDHDCILSTLQLNVALVLALAGYKSIFATVLSRCNVRLTKVVGEQQVAASKQNYRAVVSDV